MKFPAAFLVVWLAACSVWVGEGVGGEPAKGGSGAAEKAPGAGAAKAAVAPGGPVRLQFVPAKKGEGKGASGTDLSAKSFDPGARTAMISLGLGDSFPVMDEKGHQLFMLRMTDGNDQHLVLEVSSTDAKKKEAVEKVAVVRDGVTDVTVNGVKYEVSFPTMQVNPADGTVTHEATIFVAQRP